jgi:RNA polymerase sigma factor (TIGR02999 family)
MIQRHPCVTDLLGQWRDGDSAAGEAALGLVYDELRSLAERYLRREAPGHTLQPTALVHEAYLRLVRGSDPSLTDRAHLIGIAARLMRQILVNHARDRKALRRGGAWQRVHLDPAVALFEDRCHDLLALDEALERLDAIDSRQARVVELRFFGGLANDEVARLLDTSPRTVEREWAMARAWLRREIREA